MFLSQLSLTQNLLDDQGFTMSLATIPMVAGLQLETAKPGENPIEPSKYLSIIGSLSYLAVGTRPDLAFKLWNSKSAVILIAELIGELHSNSKSQLCKIEIKCPQG